MKRILAISSALALGALIAGGSPGQASAHGWGGGGFGGGGFGGGGWRGGWGGGGWHGGWGGGRFGIGFGYGFGYGVGYGFGHGFGYGYGAGFAPFYARPYYYAPPVYYAPPAYYAAPPSYYYSPYPRAAARAEVDPQSSDAASGQSCSAGSYVCPMEVAVPAGARCYCPGNDGSRVYGSAH